MKFRQLLILLAFLTGISTTKLIAQPTEETSRETLQRLIETHTTRDSIRVNALVDIQEFFLLDDYKLGRNYAFEALQISEEIGYKDGIGFSSNAIASNYMRQGQLDSALIFTLNAIDVLEAIDEDQNIYAAYNNLALIYKNKGEFGKAVEIYGKMLDRLEGREITPSFAIVYFNIASIYEAQQDWENYEPWIRKMYDTSQSLNFTPGIIEAELGLAKVAIHNFEYTKAIELSNSVLKQTDANGVMAQTSARARYILGDAFSELQDYREAIDNYSKSLEIYRQLDSPHYAAEIYLKLSEVYRKTNRFENALESRITYHQIQDSLNSQEKVALIEELQTKFETERIQREKETAELENLRLAAENRRGRGLLAGATGFLLFFMMASGFDYRQQKLKKQNELATLQLKEAEKRLAIEKKKRDAELSAVRSQLNPHFIFNLLNSIQELNISGDRSSANKALNNVAVMMRMTLKHSQEAYIPLKNELDLVGMYLEAEQLRFGDRINFEIEVDEEVEDEFIKIPPMLIQPYVENAIKHGLMHKTEPGKIEIHIQLKNQDVLEIIIEDDGVGRKKSAEIAGQNPARHNTFSTKANQERIRNLAEEANADATIEIVDKFSESGAPEGTKVRILIPTNLGS